MVTNQVVDVFAFVHNAVPLFECTMCAIVFIAASVMLLVNPAESGLRMSSSVLQCVTLGCRTLSISAAWINCVSFVEHAHGWVRRSVAVPKAPSCCRARPIRLLASRKPCCLHMCCKIFEPTIQHWAWRLSVIEASVCLMACLCWVAKPFTALAA